MIDEMLDGSAKPGIPTPPRNEQVAQEVTKMAALVFNTLSTPAGKDLLQMLEDKFLYATTFQPGAPDGYAEFRAGQNDIILFFRNSMKAAQAGQAAPEKGTNSQ